MLRHKGSDGWSSGCGVDLLAGPHSGGRRLKALAPPVSNLALPVVGPAGTRAYREADCKVLNEVLFACQGSRMRVTVRKRI